MIELDFELRSKVDITEVGAWKYSLDPTTELICFSFTLEDFDEPQIWIKGQPFPQWVFDIEFIKSKGGIRAHNAAFEQAIWYNIGVLQFGWAEVPPRYWADTMAQAAAHAIPMSLEKVGEAINLPIRKSEEGKRVMLQLSQPRRPSKSNPKLWFEPEDYPAKFETLYSYNKDDVRTQRCLGQCLPPLIKKEQWVWVLNEIINQRGIEIDIPLVDNAIAVINAHAKWGEETVKTLTNGEVETPAQVAKLAAWIRSRGVPTENVNKASLELLLQRNDLPEDVRKVLEIRKSLSKSSTKKLYAMKKAAANDNRVRYTLLYHGASTGRFAGRLIQIQNFPRGSIDNVDEVLNDLSLLTPKEFLDKYNDPMECISSSLRGLIIPAKGKDLLAADYNAIEARVVLWLAGEFSALDAFRSGADLYKDMASIIFGVPVNEITKLQRQIGKSSILGCGFGMGAAKFYTTNLPSSPDLTEELSEKAVRTYRETYPGVPALWNEQENAAISAVTTGEKTPAGHVTWFFDKQRNFLYCTLPSGRNLAYYAPALQDSFSVKVLDKHNKFVRMVRCSSRSEMMEALDLYKKQGFKVSPIVKEKLTFMAVNSVTKQWERTDTWGGSLVENIVQAIARDCMIEGLFRTEKKGYTTIMTIHDEVVAEIPEGFGSVEEFESLLAQSPDWAPDLPLKTEGWRGKRYKK